MSKTFHVPSPEEIAKHKENPLLESIVKQLYESKYVGTTYYVLYNNAENEIERIEDAIRRLNLAGWNVYIYNVLPLTIPSTQAWRISAKVSY